MSEPTPNGDTAILTTFESEERCALTESERAAKGSELARLVGDHRDLRESHANERRAMKMREDSLLSNVYDLQEDVKTGTELRMVDVAWVAHWSTNEAKLVRLDTEEVLRVRDLEDHERQLRVIPLGTSAPKKKSPKVEDLDDDLPGEP